MYPHVMWCPGTTFTKSLWAHNSNLAEIYVALMWIIMIISGQNFAHAMTAELSWHVQICDVVGAFKSELGHFKIFQLLTHKPKEFFRPVGGSVQDWGNSNDKPWSLTKPLNDLAFIQISQSDHELWNIKKWTHLPMDKMAAWLQTKTELN